MESGHEDNSVITFEEIERELAAMGLMTPEELAENERRAATGESGPQE